MTLYLWNSELSGNREQAWNPQSNSSTVAKPLEGRMSNTPAILTSAGSKVNEATLQYSMAKNLSVPHNVNPPESLCLDEIWPQDLLEIDGSLNAVDGDHSLLQSASKVFSLPKGNLSCQGPSQGVPVGFHPGSSSQQQQQQLSLSAMQRTLGSEIPVGDLKSLEHDFEFLNLEFVRPTRMNKVYIVFASVLLDLDLLYVVYNVPTIGICRAEQREKACQRLGISLPPSLLSPDCHNLKKENSGRLDSLSQFSPSVTLESKKRDAKEVSEDEMFLH
jgi:hypothetical protein